MIERVLNFGSNNELSGIMTLPEPEIIKEEAPSIIFLNAGLLHKTGFNRFNTDLARLLALSGFCSLRFDLHGLGDSSICYSSVMYDKQVIIDIQQAIDQLTQSVGYSNCVLIGLCSGADYAHTAATVDKRISGLVLLDGYAYPTLGFYIRDYGPGLFKPIRSIRFIVNKIIKKITISATVSDNSNWDNDIYLRPFPDKKQVIKELQDLINRGVNLFYIYSGGIPIYYNYANQFFDMFRSVNFKDRVSHCYIKEADHTYTIVSIRQRLMSIVTEWINKIYT